MAGHNYRCSVQYARAKCGARETGPSGGGRSAPTGCRLIDGSLLAADYARVLVVRLHELELLGDDSPFTALRDANVGEAAAWVIAGLFNVAPKKRCAVAARDLAENLLGSAVSKAPPTLWLLDGFDELSCATKLALSLKGAVTAAFDQSRRRNLASPSAAPAEVEFRSRPAAKVAPAGRLAAVLRVLLTQQNVVISSRPEFQNVLAPFTGRQSARFLRLEPLPTQSVVTFVEGALKVLIDPHSSCDDAWRANFSLRSSLFTQSDERGLQHVKSRMSNASLLEAMQSPAMMLVSLKAVFNLSWYIEQSESGSQYATAVYRRGGNVFDAAAADDVTGAGDGLPVAPGGPDDAALRLIDSRSPVSGFLVRVERLFAAQVCNIKSVGMLCPSHPALCSLQVRSTMHKGGTPIDDDSWRAMWLRLRARLTEAALESCASTGAQHDGDCLMNILPVPMPA